MRGTKELPLLSSVLSHSSLTPSWALQALPVTQRGPHCHNSPPFCFNLPRTRITGAHHHSAPSGELLHVPQSLAYVTSFYNPLSQFHSLTSESPSWEAHSPSRPSSPKAGTVTPHRSYHLLLCPQKPGLKWRRSWVRTASKRGSWANYQGLTIAQDSLDFLDETSPKWP